MELPLNLTDDINHVTMVWSNATDVVDDHSNNVTNQIALNIINGLIGFLGIAGNGLVLTVIFSNWKTFPSLTHLLIVHQSVIDFASAFVFTTIRMDRWQPLLAIPGPVGEIFCRLWHSEYPLWALFMISTLNLVLLSTERYLAVVHPVVHLNKVTRRKVKICMAAIWFFGFIYQSYLAFINTNINGECVLGWTQGTETLQTFVGIMTFLFEYMCPVCIMSVEYILIALKLRGLDKSRSRRRATLNRINEFSCARTHPDRRPIYDASNSTLPVPSVVERNEQALTICGTDGLVFQQTDDNMQIVTPSRRYENKLSRAFRNVIRTLIIVFIVNMVCWTPAEFEYIIYNLGGNVDFDSIFHKMSVVLILCNMVCNPFVYSIQYKEFQTSFRKTFCSCIRKNRVDASNGQMA